MKNSELLNSKQAAMLLGWPERGSKLRGMVRRFPADATGPRGGKLFKRETVESWADATTPANIRAEKLVMEAIDHVAPDPNSFRASLRSYLSKGVNEKHRIPHIFGYLKCQGELGWRIMRHVATWPGRPCEDYIIDRLGRFMILDGWDRDDVAEAIPKFKRLLNPRLDLAKEFENF